MSKLIIENNSDLSDFDAMFQVLNVVKSKETGDCKCEGNYTVTHYNLKIEVYNSKDAIDKPVTTFVVC